MSTCAFSNGFDSGFQICVTSTDDAPAHRGVPPIGKPRRRPQVCEIRGTGLVPVIGTAKPVPEKVLSAEVLVDVLIQGEPTGEALRVLLAQIPTGAEAVFAGEASIRAEASATIGGAGRIARDSVTAGTGAIVALLAADVRADSRVRGGMIVRSAGEGMLRGEESDEVVLLAAAALLRRLTRR